MDSELFCHLLSRQRAEQRDKGEDGGGVSGDGYGSESAKGSRESSQER
jgi:hypothetical protein